MVTVENLNPNNHGMEEGVRNFSRMSENSKFSELKLVLYVAVQLPFSKSKIEILANPFSKIVKSNR